MPNIDQAEGTNWLAASLAKATYTATVSPVRGRLMSANGTWTANGTELTNAGGSAYASVDVTSKLGTVAASAVTNTSDITWTNLPASTVVGLELWDSAGTPKRKWFGALSASKTVALGDSLTIAASALNISVA